MPLGPWRPAVGPETIRVGVCSRGLTLPESAAGGAQCSWLNGGRVTVKSWEVRLL